MEESRAYTRINHGNAVLGNCFAERVWSAFIGNTVSLIEKPSGREWTRKRSPEFFFATETALIDLMTLGNVSWSEFYTPHGAGINCEKGDETLQLSMDMMCFHSCAGIRRLAALTNISSEPMTIQHAAFETLAAPDLPNLEHIENYVPPEAANVPEEWRWAVFAGRSGGLLIGAAGACEFRMNSPEQGQWSWIAQGPVTLGPGEHKAFPETMLAHFAGPLEESAQGVLAKFFTRRAQAASWEAEVRAEAEGEGNGDFGN